MIRCAAEFFNFIKSIVINICIFVGLNFQFEKQGGATTKNVNQLILQGGIFSTHTLTTADKLSEFKPLHSMAKMTHEKKALR